VTEIGEPEMIYEASARAGGPGDNQIAYWPRLLDWTNQTLTPNPDVVYLMPFINTQQTGPVVLEVPAAGDDGALVGSIMNYWQTAIEDIGPAGVDQGRGGKCLILPPGFDGDVPAGYIVLRSDTYQCYGLIRSVLRGGSDHTRDVLTAAIQEARAWLDDQYTGLFIPFSAGARWALPAPAELIQATEAFFGQPDAYPFDARGTAYSFAFFSSRHLGKGQFYLMTIEDRAGQPLDGAASYRLRVPADAPVSQYWSATAYNRDTHTLIRDVPRPGRSSQSPGLKPNPDGPPTSTSAPSHPRARSPTGSPPTPEAASRSCSGSTAPSQPCSTKHGSYPTSSQHPAANQVDTPIGRLARNRHPSPPAPCRGWPASGPGRRRWVPRSRCRSPPEAEIPLWALLVTRARRPAR
jgi:hypothetical protein